MRFLIDPSTIETISMRLPIRKSEQLKQKAYDENTAFLTADGLERLKKVLHDLEDIQLPQAVQDVRRTGEFGDFSENAEYQEAKSRMRRLHSRIFSLKERIKHAVVIQQDKNKKGQVQLGSTVILEKDGQQKTYEIVGPQETDPLRGRISHVSPLGSAILGRKQGEEITILGTEKNETTYRIIRII
ncbi:TPA: transcription elongation factor GreA [Candidatus Uhrbacteria bacterium]|nr:transcription elongation factor GreA [Candidatus Uhrbacteria bacterium]